MNSPANGRSDRVFKSDSANIGRTIPLIACIGSVGLCLAYAKFRADLPTWWASYGGGIPYVLFWILLWFVALPKRKWIVPICVFCVTFTCFLEIAQLWNPEPIATFRKTRFGAALLGSTFVWNDFPPYLMGGGLGYIVLQALVRVDRQWNRTETAA